MMKRFGLLVLACSVAACSGGDDDVGACAGTPVGGNSLDGSYCEGLEMLFSDVRLKVQESGDSKFITIDYLLQSADSTTPQKTLTILFEASAVMIEVDKMIPLLDAGGQVRRITADMILDLTDELEDSSQITFTTYTGDVGTDAKGNFGFLFKNGRTLSGTFEGQLVDARSTVGE
jgi:hypothetical protein